MKPATQIVFCVITVLFLFGRSSIIGFSVLEPVKMTVYLTVWTGPSLKFSMRRYTLLTLSKLVEKVSQRVCNLPFISYRVRQFNIHWTQTRPVKKVKKNAKASNFLFKMHLINFDMKKFLPRLAIL